MAMANYTPLAVQTSWVGTGLGTTVHSFVLVGINRKLYAFRHGKSAVSRPDLKAIDIAVDSVTRNPPMFNVDTPTPVRGNAILERWPLVEPHRRRRGCSHRWLRQNRLHAIQNGADLTGYPDFLTNDSQVENRNGF